MARPYLNRTNTKADCRDKAQWDMLVVPECREVRKEDYMSLGQPSETASENKITHTHTQTPQTPWKSTNQTFSNPRSTLPPRRGTNPLCSNPWPAIRSEKAGGPIWLTAGGSHWLSLQNEMYTENLAFNWIPKDSNFMKSRASDIRPDTATEPRPCLSTTHGSGTRQWLQALSSKGALLFCYLNSRYSITDFGAFKCSANN